MDYRTVTLARDIRLYALLPAMYYKLVEAYSIVNVRLCVLKAEY